LIYSTTPLEKIYTSRTESLLNTGNRDIRSENESTAVEKTNFAVEHGKVYTRKEGDSYIIEGIQSTDMQDYLKTDYAPGNNFPCNKGC
jgi:hypothetical protein